MALFAKDIEPLGGGVLLEEVCHEGLGGRAWQEKMGHGVCLGRLGLAGGSAFLPASSQGS